MNKQRKKKLKWLRKLRQAARDLYSEYGVWPAKHKPLRHDAWLVTYKSSASVEIFWRDAGFIRGTGPCASLADAERSLFRQQLLANRPPCHSPDPRVQAAFDQGYFVVKPPPAGSS